MIHITLTCDTRDCPNKRSVPVAATRHLTSSDLGATFVRAREGGWTCSKVIEDNGDRGYVSYCPQHSPKRGPTDAELHDGSATWWPGKAS